MAREQTTAAGLNSALLPPGFDITKPEVQYAIRQLRANPALLPQVGLTWKQLVAADSLLRAYERAAQPIQAPTTNVAQDRLAQLAELAQVQPQEDLADQGIAQVTPDDAFANMAGGGIVAFNGEDQSDVDVTEIMRRSYDAPELPTPEERRAAQWGFSRRRMPTRAEKEAYASSPQVIGGIGGAALLPFAIAGGGASMLPAAGGMALRGGIPQALGPARAAGILSPYAGVLGKTAGTVASGGAAFDIFDRLLSAKQRQEAREEGNPELAQLGLGAVRPGAAPNVAAEAGQRVIEKEKAAAARKAAAPGQGAVTTQVPSEAAPAAPSPYADIIEEARRSIRNASGEMEMARSSAEYDLKQKKAALKDEDAYVEEVRKREEAAGIGKAEAEQRAKLAAREAKMSAQKETQTWFAAADAFFKMAEEGAKPGQAGSQLTKLLGAAGAGGRVFANKVSDLNDKYAAAQERLEQAQFDLAKAEEARKAGQLQRGSERFQQAQARVDAAQRRLEDITLKATELRDTVAGRQFTAAMQAQSSAETRASQERIAALNRASAERVAAMRSETLENLTDVRAEYAARAAIAKAIQSSGAYKALNMQLASPSLTPEKAAKIKAEMKRMEDDAYRVAGLKPPEGGAPGAAPGATSGFKVLGVEGK